MEEKTNEAVVQSGGGARLKKSNKKPLVIVGIAAGILLAAYLGLCAYAGALNTFYPNRNINGIDMGGLTVSEAQAKLETELLAQKITLTDSATGITAVVTVADLGYTAADFAGDAQYWKDSDKQERFFKKGWAYLSFATGRWPGGANWPDMDQAALEETAARLAGTFAQAPLDSTYELTDSAIRITKARDGWAADGLEKVLADISAYSQDGYQVSFFSTTVPAKTLTAQEIYDEVSGEVKNAGYDAETDSIIPEQVGAEFDVAAAQAALDAAEPGETVSIDAVIEYPTVTAEELQEVLFRDVLGEARTQVKGTAARKSNVNLSAAAINSYVMNTGDIFSYNGVVGQRTAARGYQPAPAYVKGETVDEIGGGICQTSSTLYLACLRANLAITERYAHRYIPTYITPGMDATVSWGGPDYKFANDTSYPIKIVTEYAGGYLTVRILGTKTDDITVKMTNEFLSSTPYETVYEDDETLAPGTEQVKTTPYVGSKYKTYRNLYDGDGNLISSTYEATSDYKARNKVILRGPAKETEPAAPVIGPSEIADPPVEEPVTDPPVEEPEPPMIVIPEEFPDSGV